MRINYTLFLYLAIAIISFWRAEAQIIPLTISRAENRLSWREAVFNCWDQYEVSEPRVAPKIGATTMIAVEDVHSIPPTTLHTQFKLRLISAKM